MGRNTRIRARRSWPQGDPRLLESNVARRLLTCTIPTCVAYLAVDGTPRVVPTWFHWTGDELGMPTFVSALRAAGTPPPAWTRWEPTRTWSSRSYRGPPTQVLSVPGKAAVSEVDGVALEYALVARSYMGGGCCRLPRRDRPARQQDGAIAVRPTWVGIVDLQTRLPEAWAA